MQARVSCPICRFETLATCRAIGQPTKKRPRCDGEAFIPVFNQLDRAVGRTYWMSSFGRFMRCRRERVQMLSENFYKTNILTSKVDKPDAWIPN